MLPKKFSLTLTASQALLLRSMTMFATTAWLAKAINDLQDVNDDHTLEVNIIKGIHEQTRLQGAFHAELLLLLQHMLTNNGISVTMDVSASILSWMRSAVHLRDIDPRAPNIIAGAANPAEQLQYAAAVDGLRKAVNDATPIPHAETGEEISVTAPGPGVEYVQ